MTKRLALTILVGALSPIFISGVSASDQDFEAEFQQLIEQFDDSMASTTAAEVLQDSADNLYDRIRQFRRDNRDELSKAELDSLQDLSREARGLRATTRLVGQTHNAAQVSIESFDRVKDRLGLEPRVLQTHESGLEVVQIDVGGFTSLLFRNPTTTDLTVMYGTNDPESSGGVGSAMCESYSVMSGLYNSRDREIEGVEFTIRTHEVSTKGCD